MWVDSPFVCPQSEALRFNASNQFRFAGCNPAFPQRSLASLSMG